MPTPIITYTPPHASLLSPATMCGGAGVWDPDGTSISLFTSSKHTHFLLEEPQNLRRMIETIANIISAGSTEAKIKAWVNGEDTSAEVFIKKCEADALLATKINKTYKGIEPFRNRVALYLTSLHVKFSQPGHARLTPTEAGIIYNGGIKLKTSSLLQDPDVLALFYLLKTHGYYVKIERGPQPSCGVSEANLPMGAASTKPEL